MENQTTPQWLKDGAFELFCKKTTYLVKANYCSVLFVTLIFIICFACIMFFTSINQRDLFWYEVITAISSFFSSLPIVKYLLVAPKRRKIGAMKYWQNLYLQSKIDEFESYQTSMNFDITEIETKALDQIIDIQNNFEEMKKKADQARQLLAS